MRRECEGRVLKVIVETCLLSFEEKLAAAHLVSGSRADFIKTSTGFSASGATADDVALLVKECRGKQVKAAGGICTPDDARALSYARCRSVGLKLAARDAES